MEPRQHRIGKLIFNLELDSETVVKELQLIFPTTFENRLKEELSSSFSQIPINNESIIIDRLELNLGVVTHGELYEALRKQLTKALLNRINGREKDGDRRNMTKISSSEYWSEVLIYFLQKGHYPWWAGQLTINELEDAVLKETATGNPYILSKLKSTLALTGTRYRLKIQFSPRFNRQLISNFYPKLAEFIFQTTGMISDIFIKNIATDKETFSEWTDLVWLILIQTDDVNDFKERFSSQLFSLICIENKLNPKHLLMQLPEPIKSVLTENQNLRKVTTPAITIKNEEVERDLQTKKEMVITNSGLVIFWPYLKTLFENLKLLSGVNFISQQHQEKALLFLQYLVTGYAKAEEHELQLNKILTGWPLIQPVRKSIRLSKDEKAELNEFLMEMCKNWTVLKNTSIESLRETFLQRHGILRSGDRSYHLKVERKGVDILRDNLPWPISTIKEPWMSEILYVEW